MRPTRPWSIVITAEFGRDALSVIFARLLGPLSRPLGLSDMFQLSVFGPRYDVEVDCNHRRLHVNFRCFK